MQGLDTCVEQIAYIKAISYVFGQLAQHIALFGNLFRLKRSKKVFLLRRPDHHKNQYTRHFGAISYLITYVGDSGFKTKNRFQHNKSLIDSKLHDLWR